MINFLSNNMGTILTGLFLLAMVTMVIIKIHRDKKRNKCVGCPCGCVFSEEERYLSNKLMGENINR